jgi:hypothetical protein
LSDVDDDDLHRSNRRLGAEGIQRALSALPALTDDEHSRQEGGRPDRIAHSVEDYRRSDHPFRREQAPSGIAGPPARLVAAAAGASRYRLIASVL